MQQDSLIAKSVVCLPFSMSHSIFKKTIGRCSWKYGLFHRSSELFIVPFQKPLSSCDFRRGKIKAVSDV